MSTKRKLRTLTLREKIEVIKAVKSGLKKKDVAAQYGLPASTLSTIIKNEDEILLRYELSSNLSCKRRRLVQFPDLEKCLLTWLKRCRNKKISVSGPILREKAKEFSKSLGHRSFRASNGWLSNFKKRHAHLFKKICGENARVNNEKEGPEALESDMNLEADWTKHHNIDIKFEDEIGDDGLVTTKTLNDAVFINIVNKI
ncbi:Tigger transposable element-derived protein 4 [Eumeta japonica]|uniref:Tigger transposable element-derived protein 4 n=1 Tax=Eumeta variegata TaxID=151549 RepID=A0A4C1VV30_EUMVA|nr:Tigger transposable element-derived protein 4 [Eumeta japonica]